MKPAIMICSGECWEPDRFQALSDVAETALRDEVRREIVTHGITTGYTSGSAGAEIIFAEEVLARAGELHLHLPCPVESFIEQYVTPAGSEWTERFRAVCAAANTVDISCEERPQADETLLRFNNQILQGIARIQAERQGTRARLLLAWSPSSPAEPGSPADFMDAWPEIEYLSLIDLDEIAYRVLGEDGALPQDISPGFDGLSISLSPLVVRAIFFADIATYTSIPDDEVPLLWDFLAEVQQNVEACTTIPIVINTWGDAIHAAAETALDMAQYATALVDNVLAIDHAAFGLSSRPRFRIALHAGPVYVGLHPLTGRSMIYGHHVNRAARIEPVAAPGEIYASQPFVALMRAEMDAAEHEARLTGNTYRQAYDLEYVGLVDLPKKFGSEAIYRISSTGHSGHH